MHLVERHLTLGARVVCFSDVHGNVAALEAVLEAARLREADLVVLHGDLVNRGPRSDVVWDRVFGLADERWVISQGNHERYVRNHLDGPGHTGLMADIHRSSAWTFAQLGTRARGLVGWPDGVRVHVEGLPELCALHASTLSDEAGLSPETPGDRARQASAGPWGTLVVGHVHRAYDFLVGDKRVINAGSVGSACDGTRQAGWVEAHAQANGWQIERCRVPYDLERTEHDYRTSGFLSGGGPVARLVFEEWRRARPVVRPWFATELDRVKAGHVDLTASIDGFVEKLD